MLYTIATNATFDSREVTFDGKPAETVRAALKALRMRWNPKRALWYGFAAEDEITATITATAADLVPLEDYVADYRPAGRNWINLGNGESVQPEMYYARWNAQAAGHAAGYIPEIQRQAAETEYGFSACTGCHQINQYHIAKYTEYTPAFLAKLEAVNNIIANYNYDDSNAMVDYFDTNFYWYLNVKIV